MESAKLGLSCSLFSVTHSTRPPWTAECGPVKTSTPQSHGAYADAICRGDTGLWAWVSEGRRHGEVILVSLVSLM